MSRTALKKSILFALTVILLVVYIFQVSLNGREKKTTLSVKKDVDCVEIENVRGGIRLDKVDGVWKVSTVKNPDLKFETEEYAVKNIVDLIFWELSAAVKRTRCRGTVLTMSLRFP